MRKRNLKLNFRMMTEEEMNELNKFIAPKFGNTNMISSGTIEVRDGKKICNIVFGDSVSHKSTSMVKHIGEYVKKILKYDEVYHFGVRAA